MGSGCQRVAQMGSFHPAGVWIGTVPAASFVDDLRLQRTIRRSLYRKKDLMCHVFRKNDLEINKRIEVKQGW